jgi:hypothetical protein
LADALVAVREGGVDCDFSKIRIEDALDDMADLLAEVKRLREANRSLFLQLSDVQGQLNRIHRGEEE